MTEPNGRADRLDFIQALRGLAAFAVVMFHARIAIGDVGDRLFAMGFSGVDLFFVISGFIMVHTTWHLAGGRHDATAFFAKRFARIWPVYVILTVLFVVVTGDAWHLFSTASGLRSLGKAFVFYPQHRQTAPFFGYAPDVVGWTLNYEVWFYLLFAVSLLGRRYRAPLLVALFGVFLIAIPLAATGQVDANPYRNPELHPTILSLAANPLIWEFLAGAAIGAIYRSRLRIGNAAVLTCVAVASVALVLWQFLWHWRGQHGPLNVGLPMAVMVLALALRNKVRPFAVPRVLVWLGDISFSLYLVHRIAQLGLSRLGLGLEGLAFVVVSTVLALALAHASYVLLERGVAERFRAWLLRRAG